MKIILLFLMFGCLFSCKERSLSTSELTQITVARIQRTDTLSQINKLKDSTTTLEKKHQVTEIPKAIPQKHEPKTVIHPYHIIVSSYAISEKIKAENKVARLIKEQHAASLLSSPQRYRVSIASFATEQEANAALPKYRSITKRNDIWVHREMAKKEE